MSNQTTGAPKHYPVKASGDKLPFTVLYFRQFFTYGFDKRD
jgi:hypothetical protein